MNPCREKALVSVDVADAREKSLIQQQRFDTSLALNALAEFLERDFERFGTKPCHARGDFLGPFDGAELAGIMIVLCSLVQREFARRACLLGFYAGTRNISLS